MTYNGKTHKKCTFVKMSSVGRRIKRKKKGRKAMTTSERIKALSDWRKSWM
jgi:hypothetical protein